MNIMKLLRTTVLKNICERSLLNVLNVFVVDFEEFILFSFACIGASFRRVEFVEMFCFGRIIFFNFNVSVNSEAAVQRDDKK